MALGRSRLIPHHCRNCCYRYYHRLHLRLVNCDSDGWCRHDIVPLGTVGIPQ